MQDYPLVSVIIPVYNIEQYIDKSLQSVVDQTYRNLEIILVDDGSKDQSGVICDQWAEKDQRIIVIHKQNGGLSSARNAALDICTGDFVYFVDGDDYIATDAVEVLINDALKTGADIVEAYYYDVIEDKCIGKENKAGIKLLSTAEAIRYMLGTFGGSISAWSKIYRHSIFSETRFMEGKIQEDLFALVDIVSAAKLIAIEPRRLYYYVHRKNSITTEPFNARTMDTVEACYYNYEKIKKAFPEAIDVAEYRLDFYTLQTIEKIMLLEDWKQNPYLPGLLESVRKNKKRIFKSNFIKRSRKIAFWILLVNVSAYHAIVMLKARKRTWSN